MPCTDTVPHSRYYIATYRNHILDPVSTATNRVEQEQRELERERDAYTEFATRVESISSVEADPSASCDPPLLTKSPTSSTDDLRQAYEETVMAVPHFDSVYGESVGEHLVAEFGEEFATLFAASSTVSFAASHKERLLAAITTKVEERDRFLTTLEDERESLLTAYEELESILADLDSPIVPSWYRDQFEARIDEILDARQNVIQRRPSLAPFDSHDLCGYLYRDNSWTYPVLTALGRLLDTTVKRA